uniref:Uncharacterized protein n=1 Tax=Lygus hesperus TaxID=30085 RepID=A0A0A9Z260_LYGHE
MAGDTRKEMGRGERKVEQKIAGGEARRWSTKLRFQGPGMEVRIERRSDMVVESGSRECCETEGEGSGREESEIRFVKIFQTQIGKWKAVWNDDGAAEIEVASLDCIDT